MGSFAPAMAKPPMPTPTSAPLTAATFQLIRDFFMGCSSASWCCVVVVVVVVVTVSFLAAAAGRTMNAS
jgi:hypothetical protein